MNVFNSPMKPLTVAEATTSPSAPHQPYVDAQPHGGAAVLELVGWCALVLVTVNTLGGFLGALVGGVWPSLASTLLVLAVMSWVAVVPVVVVGWPLGVLTAWLLTRVRRESRHVLVFAAVGAVAAVVLARVGATVPAGGATVAVLAVEGALGAGGGRLLLGVARRRRAARAAVRPSVRLEAATA